MKKMTPYDADLMLFHNATGIPFCVFDNSTSVLFRYPMIETMECSPTNLMQCSRAIQSQSSDVPILAASGVCFFALLALNDHMNIMLGPISSIPLTFTEFCQYNDVMADHDDLLHLYLIMQQSPLFSLSRFAENVSLFLKLVLHKDIDCTAILANQRDTYHSEDMPSVQSSDQDQKYNSISETISFQKQILYHITNGNIAKIEELFDVSDFFIQRIHVPSTIEELQKFYVIYITLCCIAVLEEGTKIQKAIPFFDSYLAKIHSIQSNSDLFILCRQISLDYCHLIRSMQQNISSSSIVTNCLQYIQEHIQTRITLTDLAKHCNTSTRTISRQFEKYYPVSASACIMQQKLKEAVFFLTNSSMSLIELSNYLGFSSQSHFITAFKKQYHCTPQKYRSNHATSHTTEYD